MLPLRDFFTFEQIYRHMTQDAEIFRCMAFSAPAMVFSKRDIQTPMLAVFDAAVLAINGLEGFQEAIVDLILEEQSDVLTQALKCKGPPVGATGVSQLIEVWTQLRHKAGARQIPNNDLHLGATHNLGGTGGTATFTILERS